MAQESRTRTQREFRRAKSFKRRHYTIHQITKTVSAVILGRSQMMGTHQRFAKRPISYRYYSYVNSHTTSTQRNVSYNNLYFPRGHIALSKSSVDSEINSGGK